MAEKKTIKLADLLQVEQFVDVSPTQNIKLRPLTLTEMVNLLLKHGEKFLALYSKGLSGEITVEKLAPAILAMPQLAADIIAFASDEPESAETVVKRMAATVQLIALAEIWKMSVPDPKKAKELLSEVMAQLLKRSEEANVGVESIKPPTSS